MFNETNGAPSGYVYPPPSIEGGQTSSEPRTSPKTLSRESVEKIRNVVRRIDEYAEAQAVARKRSR